MIKQIAQIICFILAVTAMGRAEVKFTGKYEENFDTLNEEVKFPETAKQAFQSDIPRLSGWQVARIGGTENTKIELVLSDGSASTGSLYSFGRQGEPDRSLGSISTLNASIAFGLALVNKTGKTIDTLDILFEAEVWRSPTRKPDFLAFSYGLSGTSITKDTYLSSSDMLLDEKFDVRGPDAGHDNIPVDGKAEKNRIGTKGTLSGLQWKPEQVLFLRWTNNDTKGAGSGLAMDNLVIQAQ